MNRSQLIGSKLLKIRQIKISRDTRIIEPYDQPMPYEQTTITTWYTKEKPSINGYYFEVPSLNEQFIPIEVCKLAHNYKELEADLYKLLKSPIEFREATIFHWGE